MNEISQKIFLYNTLTRRKEEFIPNHPPHVGMYVCGPTVYGDAHLGHARPAVTFDVIYRYLKYCGYKVRYVRNITDVGHLENDADEGEDKIQRKARLEQLEPMEIVQRYTNSYHRNMDQLNVLRPDIEPRATGHIIEQLELVKKILENGFAYVSEGSVYFDVEKYNRKYPYGILSGRRLEELQTFTRELEGTSAKRSPYDFALWKKAQPTHIMRWPSPWSDGFPGWHLECSAMGARYLGETFDIHGGGMDLIFPHHEAEIAQSVAANGKQPVRFWLHNNMVTINGQKMGKSLGNFITLDKIFSGNHPKLEKAYSPMNIRFFILQAHYRSTLDFSNEALQAAEKGYKRLMEAWNTLQTLTPTHESTYDANHLRNACFEAMNDDFNTPVVIAHLFEAVKTINNARAGTEKLDATQLQILKDTFSTFLFDILGLVDEKAGDNSRLTEELIRLLIEIRLEARARKDWATSDRIRDRLKEIGIQLKDGKEGTEWSYL
ncbi:MAG: cysteinyl-tRNA synthetase [Bacteroidales bacterium]|jgi:cysteinyl-tRNA synthetase|nr:cysteinyl-tRNA synthetase [Bacteroidales bacterium]MDN5329144.1 cysteinyl-tRNA synthetase [Bacteroidales bacterium]